MRVIIRFSLHNDPDNALRHALTRPLGENGLRFEGATHTFEGDIGPEAIGHALGRFWAIAAQPGWGDRRVDHFWMYYDQREA